jgi:hypothetical protein
MVSRAEFNFTSEWFLNKYIEVRQPLGSIVNPDMSTTYSDLDLERLKNRVHTLISENYINVIEENFSDQQIYDIIFNFAEHPISLTNTFQTAFKLNFPKGATRGNILSRLAPFFRLEKDSLDINFDLSENECIYDPINIKPTIDYSDLTSFYKNNPVPNALDIRQGCNVVMFEYDNDRTKAQIIFENLEYPNKSEKLIIINGNKFAELLNLDLTYFKNLAIISFVPNNSTVILKLKQHPELVVSMGSYISTWLYKKSNPRIVRQ